MIQTGTVDEDRQVRIFVSYGETVCAERDALKQLRLLFHRFQVNPRQVQERLF